MKQAGVVLVNGGEGVFDVPKRGVQDESNDAALLVGKERRERVIHAAVVMVEHANDTGKISPLHLIGGL